MSKARELSVVPQQSIGFKNRILNGAMQIDQRNAGASVTPASGSYVYSLDRWFSYTSQSSKFTVQQNAGSVTPPVGFTNYLGITSTSAYSITNADIIMIGQKIEGLNVSDLAWGTANAKNVTLSFQVYSSLTGTFGGTINNVTQQYSYPFTYTIPVANTWTTISISVVGPTSGNWITNNSIGMQINFALGVGSSSCGTAGAWTSSAGGLFSATGATSVVGTSGATFYITGVQLEKGSVATSFDYRPYGTELQLCQRYYSTGAWATGAAYPTASGALARSVTSFKVTMRATPTVTPTSASYFNAQSINFISINADGAAFEISQAGSAGNYTGAGTYKAEIEL